ncbi:MAG: nucleotidyltransferase family protein, partial [Clostridia bacterium]|nr:nucleotidyltransferase family protein [Clostridia bacterium]
MKIAAIICEFNPIHTGHKRLIDYAKTIAEKVV